VSSDAGDDPVLLRAVADGDETALGRVFDGSAAA
jgi:hypothetical protein